MPSRDIKRAAKQKKRREEAAAKQAASRPTPRATLVKKAARQVAPRAIPVKASPKDPRSRRNTDDYFTALKKSEEEDKKKRAADQLKYREARDPKKPDEMSAKQAAMLREYGPAGRKYYEGK